MILLGAHPGCHALPCHPLPCLVTLCPACAAPRPFANLAPRSHAPPRSSPWLRAEPRLHPSLAAATVSGLRVHPRGLSVRFPAAYHPSAVLFPFRVLLVFRFSVFVFCSSVVFRLLLSGSGCLLRLLAFSVRSPPSLVAMLCAVPSMRASTTSSVSLSGNVIGSQESRTRRSVRREARPSESEW